MNYVIIFFIAVFVLVLSGLEAERTEYDFEIGMKKIDSLWNVIQEINLLEQYKKAERLK